MYKMLSIVIPYYTEKEREVFPLLSSINNQVGIDYRKIECILVNDGNDNVFTDDFLKLFENLDIKTVCMPENKGPGVARQVGIDNAAGEYVMFCDADDILHSTAVLGVFLEELELHNPDMAVSPWLEELFDKQTGKYSYLTHENESTWMHGKAIKKAFLAKKNIRFDEELRVHEDSYFLAMAFAQTSNIRKVFITSYIWKYNENSITRRDNAEYTYNSITTFNKAIGKSFAQIEKIKPEDMPYKVIQFIMYNYFTLHQPHWLAEDKREFLERAEQSFAAMIKPYMHYFENAPFDNICITYNQERMRHFGQFIETELLEKWLVRVVEAHGNEEQGAA